MFTCASQSPIKNIFFGLRSPIAANIPTMQLELTEQLLRYVDENGAVDTLSLVATFGVEHQKIVGALKSIESHGEHILNVEQATHKTWELTDEGKSVLANGSHEAGVFNAVPADGIAQPDLMKVWPMPDHYCITRK